VLHGTAEPQIPSQDMPLEPQRVATHESWDSRDRSRDLPQARQQLGRQQAGRQKAISLQVQFNFNSTELTPASKARLGVVASALNTGKLANYKFRIEGHTDSVGSAQYNLKLSEHRARSVARHLTEQYHIKSSRLQTLGKGMSEPANPANPRASENRRVVIVNVGRS
jgi:Outer membrane protein and related peptidoglycan-associated (lipo)proteins